MKKKAHTPTFSIFKAYPITNIIPQLVKHFADEGACSAERRYDEFTDKSSLYFSTLDDLIPGKVKKSKKQLLANIHQFPFKDLFNQ